MARQLVVAALWVDHADADYPVDQVRLALKDLKAHGTTGQVVAYPQDSPLIEGVTKTLRRLNIQEAVLA